jgi:hypothetical protein
MFKINASYKLYNIYIKKIFMSLTPGLNVIKLFTAVIYECL